MFWFSCGSFRSLVSRRVYSNIIVLDYFAVIFSIYPCFSKLLSLIYYNEHFCSLVPILVIFCPIILEIFTSKDFSIHWYPYLAKSWVPMVKISALSKKWLFRSSENHAKRVPMARFSFYIKSSILNQFNKFTLSLISSIN